MKDRKKLDRQQPKSTSQQLLVRPVSAVGTAATGKHNERVPEACRRLSSMMAELNKLKQGMKHLESDVAKVRRALEERESMSSFILKTTPFRTQTTPTLDDVTSLPPSPSSTVSSISPLLPKECASPQCKLKMTSSPSPFPLLAARVLRILVDTPSRKQITSHLLPKAPLPAESFDPTNSPPGSPRQGTIKKEFEEDDLPNPFSSSDQREACYEEHLLQQSAGKSFSPLTPHQASQYLITRRTPLPQPVKREPFPTTEQSIPQGHFVLPPPPATPTASPCTPPQFRRVSPNSMRRYMHKFDLPTNNQDLQRLRTRKKSESSNFSPMNLPLPYFLPDWGIRAIKEL